MSKNLTKNRNTLLQAFTALPSKDRIIGFLNTIRQQKLKSLKTPENITYFITDRCNMTCKHCFYWDSLNSKTEELSLEQVKKIVFSLKNRVETLLLTGGEPMIKKEMYGTMLLFSKINKTKKIHFVTNGAFPERTYNLAKKVLETLPVELSIQVSLDGNKEYHEKLRGVKCYDNVIKTMTMLKPLKEKHSNFILTASTALSIYNLEHLDFLEKEMNKLGIEWGFQLVRGSNFGILDLDKDFIENYSPMDTSIILPPVEKLREIINRYAPEKRDIRIALQRTTLLYALELIQNKRIPLKCRAGVADAIIYSNGNVALCEITKPVANLKDYDFDFYKLWTSQNANEGRKKISCCQCMHPCHMISSMKYDLRFLENVH